MVFDGLMKHAIFHKLNSNCTIGSCFLYCVYRSLIATIFGDCLLFSVIPFSTNHSTKRSWIDCGNNHPRACSMSCFSFSNSRNCSDRGSSVVLLFMMLFCLCATMDLVFPKGCVMTFDASFEDGPENRELPITQQNAPPMVAMISEYSRLVILSKTHTHSRTNFLC